ncbi:DWNN domain-containing protein, partial [Blakeslea trispora]
MSVIYYKLRSAKDSDYDVFTFDGPGATVFDLKREIIRAKKFGKGTDFDLAVYNAQTDEEYKDDMFVVPRNTSVIVRRLPASRPGKGTAQRYVLGVLPTDGKGIVKGNTTTPSNPATVHSGRNMVLNAQRQPIKPPSFTQPNDPEDSVKTHDDSEEARIQAMFQQTTDSWGAMQEKLAEQQYIPYNNRGDSRRGRGGAHPSTGTHPIPSQENSSQPAQPQQQQPQLPQRIPPPTYVCYRCGQKGHYINQCPTNGDKDYDKHPRIKRTTGIPRSFLKVIEEPKNAVKAGTGGLMVTPKGDIVVAQADSSSWDKHVQKAATTIGLGSSSAGDLMDWYESIPVLPYFECPICHGLMREATLTSCCGASFCDECIRTHLMDHDFACQDCKQPVQNGLDGIVANIDVRESIDNYVRNYVHN